MFHFYLSLKGFTDVMVANIAVCLFFLALNWKKKYVGFIKMVPKSSMQTIVFNVIRPLSTHLIKPDFHVFNV